MPEKPEKPRLRILRAPWVFPVSRPAIRDGLVVLEEPEKGSGNGKATIVYAGEAGGFSVPGDARVDDLPDALLIPAFVNAHCHLELSPLVGAVEPNSDFTGWLKDVIQQRSVMGEELQNIRDTVQSACRHLMQNGCGTIGDFVSAFTPRAEDGLPVVEDVVHEIGLRGVFYSELIGFAPERCDAILEHLGQEMERPATEGIHRGVAPHAPYSAAPRVIVESWKQARKHGLPFAIHVSEWPDERTFLLSGDGPCAELLHWRGNWDPDWKAPGTSPVAYLDGLGVTGRDSTFVHANDLADDEVAILARTGTSVVHCPGTHAYFQRPPFGFQALLKAGVNVALGTDSLASNAALDMRREIRTAWESAPEFEANALLRMATLNGARALGLEDETGSLEAGKAADLVALKLAGESDDPDVALREALKATTPPALVVVGGVEVSGQSNREESPSA